MGIDERLAAAIDESISEAVKNENEEAIDLIRNTLEQYYQFLDSICNEEEIIQVLIDKGY